MTMFNPPHPGSILKEDVLPELGIGVTEAAAQLGVSRVAFSRVVNAAWPRIQPPRPNRYRIIAGSPLLYRLIFIRRI
jgi:hypothetical protein